MEVLHLGLGRAEHKVWQGLFKGFVTASQRVNVYPPLYKPRRYVRFQSQEQFQTIHLITQSTDSKEYPEQLQVDIQYRRNARIRALGSAQWNDGQPKPIRTSYLYAPSNILSQADIFELINRLGGILEQPDEYTFVGNL